MQHERAGRNPAAIPLIALIAGMAFAPILANPRVTVAGLLALSLLVSLTPGLKRGALITLFAALGIVSILRVQVVEAMERSALAGFEVDRFAVIEAPLERDWSLVDSDAIPQREASYRLRATHFRVNGIAFDKPIAIYTRFTPPEMAMESSLRAEGFLRTNERGEYTASIKSPRLLSYEGRMLLWHPATWNRMLANRIEPFAADYPDEVALAEALALGRGERLTKAMHDSFRGGGTYHLLVFSGLQIAFAAGALAALLRWLRRPRAADWLLLSFAALAPLFIGPTPSVSRASIAIALYALSRILKRPTSIENLWCLAALVRLLLDPGDLGRASFHLTYAGAGALVFIGRSLVRSKRALVRSRRPGRLIATLRHALAAEIAITPLTLFHFHQYALAGSLLTIIISPLILAMLAVSVAACLLPSPPLFEAIRLLHRFCIVLNKGGVSGVFAAPPLFAMICGGAGALVALALLWGRRRAIAIIAAMLIPTAAAVARSAALRSVEHPQVTFLDVGQGDAIAIRDGESTILVDGGRYERIVAQLADRGIRRIAIVVLTHAHPDHCGGLPAVLERFDVGSIWINPRRFRGDCAAAILEAARATLTPVHIARDGDELSIAGLRMTALVGDQTFRRSPENNASIVLLAVIGGRRFLFTGDIEREAELDFADRDLAADVLKVPHHGSKSSSSAVLLDAVRPRLAVISCGRHNLFGHPHPDVLASLHERRIRTWRTDRDGSVEVEVLGGKLYVRARID